MKKFFADLSIPFAAVFLSVLCEYSGLDLWLSHLFFNPEVGVWTFKEHWLTQDVLHIGGRYLVILMALCVLLALVGSFFLPRLSPYRKDLAFVLVAGVSGPAIVGMLKTVTHIYSPWDLKVFGGPYAYIRMFDQVAIAAPVGHAFPAGHASGGFAWFGVFFALRRRATPRYQLSLLLPFGLGGLFGLAQQIRGAHLLSHDLMTVAVCWMVTVFWSRQFYAKTFRRESHRNFQQALSNWERNLT